MAEVFMDQMQPDEIISHIKALQNIIVPNNTYDIQSIVQQLSSVLNTNWDDSEGEVRHEYRRLMFNLVPFLIGELDEAQLVEFADAPEGGAVIEEIIRVTSHLGNSSRDLIENTIVSARQAISTPEA